MTTSAGSMIVLDYSSNYAEGRRFEILIQSGQSLDLTCNLVPCNTISPTKKIIKLIGQSYNLSTD
jgi:hypothetical protein